MYVIIDWHSIGNLTTGVFQDPMYDTTGEGTIAFWRAMSRRYNGHNTVAFFELFNEPAAFGRVSWEEWKKIVEDQIAVLSSTSRKSAVARPSATDGRIPRSMSCRNCETC